MKFWLILLIVFFLIRYVLPVVLRLLVSSFVKKQMRQGGFGVPPTAAPTPETPPGQVRVAYVPPTERPLEKATGFKGGEYVDFEEV